MRAPKTVALIGCGALGRVFADNFSAVLGEQYRLCAVMAKSREHAEVLAAQTGARACADIEALLADRPEYVVELAGVEALAAYGETILSHGSNLIAASAGALVADKLYARLRIAAGQSGARLYVASGAVGGFDLIRTFALLGPMQISVDNRKAPESLNGAPALCGRTLSDKKSEIVFEGGICAAIAGYPKNVNVAAATALAAGGDAHVTIESVPALQENQHTIRLESKTAHAEITVCSRPDPANPRSSTFTAFSILALLENLAAPICFF